MSTDYAALANTIKIEDITSNELNREILHKLKNNDASFDKLFIMENDYSDDRDDYDPGDGDTGWLGYYISNNTNLQEIQFYKPINDESFYKEVSHNKSISRICFYVNGSIEDKIFRLLVPFFKSNNNLTEISVEDSEFGVEGARQLSLAIGSCNKSLNHVNISCNTMEIGQLGNIITALSMHPQLEQLDLTWMDIGINECTALSTLLLCTTTRLQKLNLTGNDIDDDGIEVLVNALADINTLEELILGAIDQLLLKVGRQCQLY